MRIRFLLGLMRKPTILICLCSVSAAELAASAARFYLLSVSRNEMCPCDRSVGIEAVLQALALTWIN